MVRICQLMKPLRVLVIEDDAIIGMLLSELLTGMGHGICAIAATEGEAVIAATRHRPDLMIVDASLGRVVGSPLLRKSSGRDRLPISI